MILAGVPVSWLAGLTKLFNHWWCHPRLRSGITGRRRGACSSQGVALTSLNEQRPRGSHAWDRHCLILGVIGLAQLMMVLDRNAAVKLGISDSRPGPRIWGDSNYGHRPMRLCLARQPARRL